MAFFKENNQNIINKIWRILKIIIGIALIGISVLLLFGVIGYIAIETEKENSSLISAIAGIVAINEIIALKDNFFPSENKELKELRELNKSMQKMIELKEKEVLMYKNDNINKLEINENEDNEEKILEIK
ncbi:MAG: hypothetical protein K2J11_06215 [Oscillospiraceae bacterium]|nr:hypothetical protein [Oscillospiraceae bacterium]